MQLPDGVVSDWYLFAELRVTVRERASGEVFAWHTAEFFASRAAGSWLTRIGHGTDPAVQASV